MKYFSKVTTGVQTKNKLQTAISKMIKTKDRWIFDEIALDNFKKSVTLGIELLNDEYPKCAPIEAHWWQPNTDTGDWHLNLYFISIILYQEK